MEQFGFDVQNVPRIRKEPPPVKPIPHPDGCSTCGQGQEFTVTFKCPGCGNRVTAKQFQMQA